MIDRSQTAPTDGSEASARCPACGLPWPFGNGQIRFCKSCGHCWLNRTQEDHQTAEASIFTHDYLGYRPDPSYVQAMTRLATRELLTRVPPPARLLDIGCGAGDFLAIAQTLGYSPEGIDISEASADLCRARALKSRAGDFLSHQFDGQLDVITLWDVIAHLADPAALLDRARFLLTEGGMLFIKTPGFGHLTTGIANRWPRTAGILVGAPSHCQYFNRSSLSTLLTRTGFAFAWISAGPVRSSSNAGPLKRRLARRLRNLISRLSGDSNLYVVAHPAR